MKKKVFLAGALLALMAVGAFAQTYNAESDFQVTRTATGVSISRYVGRQNVSAVNIPPTIQNLPVTDIGGGAFTPNGNITSVTIPASVTSIQATAFYVLVNLNSVTFLGTIPPSGFQMNSFSSNDLRTAFYATDRNNGTPGTYTRSGATTWTLTPAATPASTSMAETPATSFEWSRTADGRGIVIESYIGTATAVRIPDRISNLPVVEIGDQAFERKGITNVVIPNTVTRIGDSAFYNAAFTSITLPTSLVTIGSAAFAMNANLTSITIPNTVRTIGNNAFYNCTALTSVTLPSNSTATLTTIGSGAFSNCTNLTTVTIPTSVTRITFGRNAFQGSTNVNAASKTALQRVGYTGAF